MQSQAAVVSHYLPQRIGMRVAGTNKDGCFQIL